MSYFCGLGHLLVCVLRPDCAGCWRGRARSLNGSCLFGNVMWLSLEGGIEHVIGSALAWGPEPGHGVGAAAGIGTLSSAYNPLTPPAPTQRTRAAYGPPVRPEEQRRKNNVRRTT